MTNKPTEKITPINNKFMEKRTLLLDEDPLIIVKHLATLIGLNEAIIFQQLHFWLFAHKNDAYNRHEGEVWVHESPEEWKEQFPFWSASTIERTLSSLKNRGLVKTAFLHEDKRDRTRWYAIDYSIYEKMTTEDKTPENETTLEENPSSQNDKMGDSKMTRSSSSQNDKMEHVKMDRCIDTKMSSQSHTKISSQMEDKNFSSFSQNQEGEGREQATVITEPTDAESVGSIMRRGGVAQAIERKGPVKFENDLRKVQARLMEKKKAIVAANRQEYAEVWRGKETDECPNCVGRGEIAILDDNDRSFLFSCERCRKTGKIEMRRVA